MPDSWPEHSTATSNAPTSPSSVVDVANPSAAAVSSRAVSLGVPRTWTSAPAARATWAARRPIGPGPDDEHRVARADPVGVEQRVAAARERLDHRAASRPSSQSGMRCRLRAGTSRRGANPPSTNEPIDRRSGHRLMRPSRHQRQRPQVEKYVSVTMRAPRHDSSTPSPRSATTPETSCPIVTGGCEAYSPSKMWTSVPQMPAATTSTTT